MEKLTPKDRKMIDRGLFLTKQIKVLTEEFDTIKANAKMQFGEGTYLGNDGVMVISERTSFETPTPAELLKHLKSVKKADKFPDCVKVQVEATKKILDDAAWDSLKGKAKSTISVSFK